MNRYFYYLILIHMITNLPVMLPRILFYTSNKGAITSMAVGLLIGLLTAYIFTNFFNRYPGKDLPMLMKMNTSKWLYRPVIFFLAVTWYIYGMITLVKYTFIIDLFLTPEMAVSVIVFTFLLIIPYGIFMKTKSILYASEIILILLIPFLLFILIKAYFSPEFNWDFVRIAMMHIQQPPNYLASIASYYIFLGVAYSVVFNKVYTKKQVFQFKQLFIIGLLSIFILFTIYFIPIGISGFDQISDLVFPWVSTSDSIRMKYGIIGRLIFIFMPVFLSFGFISMLIQWHIAAQLLTSIIHVKRFQWKGRNLTTHLFALIFILVGWIATVNLDSYLHFKYTEYILGFSPIVVSVYLISFFAVRKGEKYNASKG